MAAPKTKEPKDPLDALQSLVNDVLVQTGKALRASRKDGKGNFSHTHGSLQARLPDTIRSFHCALDDLENDIIRAKSVLLRDLNQLQAQRAPQVAPPPSPPQPPEEQQQPQPIESQSKSPMAIDIDSSPPPPPPLTIKNEPGLVPEPAAKPMAPFPDMGMSIQDSTPPIPNIKQESAPSVPRPSPTVIDTFDSKVNVNAAFNAAAPEPMPDQKSMDFKPEDIGDTPTAQNTELNFTNMEFTLAPTNNEDQSATGPINEASFDLTTFAPADSSHDLLSLDSSLPPGGPAGGQVTAAEISQVQTSIATDQPTEAKFDDIFGPDSGAADGMDFDFSLDGGLEGDSFNDMMDDRDNNYDIMEHGDFDQAYFGLDKPEEA